VLLAALIAGGCSAGGSASAAPANTAGSEPSATAAGSPSAATSVSASTVSPSSPSALSSPAIDYRGSWSGKRLFGSISWCGGAKSPYWAVEVHAGPDQGFVAYDIAPGSDHAPAEVVTSFVDPAWNRLVAGTGTFVPGSPAHFVIVNGEGRFDVKLEAGTFCNPG
jgi:hypothetical protein